MTSVIQARSLVKRYGAFTAVDGISFDVSAGECFGLLGPNGAGKSSVIRMLACVSPVTGGTLTVGGLSVTKHPRRVKSIIGVVSQEDTLDNDFSVQGNLEVHARYYGMQPALIKERVQDALELVQLTEKRHAAIDTLSGGMKRRLVIARALVHSPLLLILDEPTTGLDPQARHLVWERLLVLKRQGVNMLLTTHYMEEAAYLCDRAVIMDHGRILVEGSPADLVRQHAGEQVLEVRPLVADRAAIKAELALRGLDVQDSAHVLYAFARNGHALSSALPIDGAEVTARRANLEDVFLRLTGRELRDE